MAARAGGSVPVERPPRARRARLLCGSRLIQPVVEPRLHGPSSEAIRDEVHGPEDDRVHTPHPPSNQPARTGKRVEAEPDVHRRESRAGRTGRARTSSEVAAATRRCVVRRALRPRTSSRRGGCRPRAPTDARRRRRALRALSGSRGEPEQARRRTRSRRSRRTGLEAPSLLSAKEGAEVHRTARRVISAQIVALAPPPEGVSPTLWEPVCERELKDLDRVSRELDIPCRQATRLGSCGQLVGLVPAQMSESSVMTPVRRAERARRSAARAAR